METFKKIMYWIYEKTIIVIMIIVSLGILISFSDENETYDTKSVKANTSNYSIDPSSEEYEQLMREEELNGAIEYERMRGYDEGMEYGYSQGVESGYKQGYEDGYEDGRFEIIQENGLFDKYYETIEPGTEIEKEEYSVMTSDGIEMTWKWYE